jgi:hypothetical protein
MLPQNSQVTPSTPMPIDCEANRKTKKHAFLSCLFRFLLWCIMADIWQYGSSCPMPVKCLDCEEGKAKTYGSWTKLCKHYYDVHWITYKSMKGSAAHSMMVKESQPKKTWSMSEAEREHVAEDPTNSRRFLCLKCDGKSLSKSSWQYVGRQNNAPN